MENLTELSQNKLCVSPAVKVLILLSLALAGLILCSVLMIVLDINPSRIADMYYAITLQDVLAFIIPAIAAMAICYHTPLRVMGLNNAPSWKGIVAALAVCAVSLPAMNWIVDWNQNIHLPESLSELEGIMREMEDAAEAVTKIMMTGESVGTLLLNLCVVAFLAGLSEEIFFRGSLLKMLTPDDRRIHLLIWVVAIIFSAIHMQFYGFIPRMLLGAWFGYLFIWTRSLWVPIIAHALNNSIVVVATWLESRGLINSESIDNIGLASNGSFPWLALASAILTIVFIVFFKNWIKKNNHR